MASSFRLGPAFLSFRGLFLALAGFLLLAGCQTTNTLPEGYSGPTATIRDSAVTGKAMAPEYPAQRPHPRYLGWHRENRFKV